MKKILLSLVAIAMTATNAFAVTKVEDSYIKDYTIAQAADTMNTFCSFKASRTAAIADAIEIGEQILVKYPAIRADIMNAMKKETIHLLAMTDNGMIKTYCKQNKAKFFKYVKILSSDGDENDNSVD